MAIPAERTNESVGQAGYIATTAVWQKLSSYRELSARALVRLLKQPILHRWLFWCTLHAMRTTLVAVTLLLALCASAEANWFNKSEQYLAGCQNEAERRYFKDTSSNDVRRHIHLCMLAHGYAFKSGCDKAGWLDPGCYRLKYKTEGR